MDVNIVTLGPFTLAFGVPFRLLSVQLSTRSVCSRVLRVASLSRPIRVKSDYFPLL